MTLHDKRIQNASSRIFTWAFSPTIIVVSQENELPASMAASGPSTVCNASSGFSNRGGRGSNHNVNPGNPDPFFDSLGPDQSRTIKWLRVFNEVGIEFQNGAASLRQVGEWLNQRSLKLRSPHYPADLPVLPTAASRCHVEMLKFFGERLELERPPMFISDGPGKPISGLTDLGWDLWSRTHRYLIRRGFIQEDS